MDESERLLALLEKVIQKQEALALRIQAVELALQTLLVRNPEAAGIISSLQILAEEMKRDGSTDDYANAVQKLCGQFERVYGKLPRHQ